MKCFQNPLVPPSYFQSGSDFNFNWFKINLAYWDISKAMAKLRQSQLIGSKSNMTACSFVLKNLYNTALNIFEIVQRYHWKKKWFHMHLALTISRCAGCNRRARRRVYDQGATFGTWQRLLRPIHCRTPPNVLHSPAERCFGPKLSDRGKFTHHWDRCCHWSCPAAYYYCMSEWWRTVGCTVSLNIHPN